MKKLFFALIIIFIFAFSLFFLNAERCTLNADVYAEDVTVTTSYPSPKGVYKDLNAEVYYDYDNLRYFLDPFPDPHAQNPFYRDLSLTVAGKVGIGTANPQARLDVRSTSGGILIPRMTYDDRMHILPPPPIPESLLVYQTDDYPPSNPNPTDPHGYYYYTYNPTSGWVPIASGGVGGGLWTKDDNGNIYHNGNVSVGTTAPLAGLRVTAAPGGEALGMEGVPAIVTPKYSYLMLSNYGYVKKKLTKRSLSGVFGNGLVYAERIEYDYSNNCFTIYNPRVRYIDNDSGVSGSPRNDLICISYGVLVEPELSARAIASAFRGKYISVQTAPQSTNSNCAYMFGMGVPDHSYWTRSSGNVWVIESVTCNYDLTP